MDDSGEEAYNAALRCERRLAILERSESAKRCESLLNALLCVFSIPFCAFVQKNQFFFNVVS